MKRGAFYKIYYERTNRIFSDHILWDGKDVEIAWKKGQQKTSKVGRKIFLVFQYLLLLGCWIPMLFNENGWKWTVFGILDSFLISLITDFSMIRIEIFYHLYKRDNLYCNLLYKAFLGDLNEFLAALAKKTKKHITGYVRKDGRMLWARYIVVCRQRSNQVFLTIRPNGVVVEVNKITYRIHDPALSIDMLEDKISDILSKELTVSNSK